MTSSPSVSTASGLRFDLTPEEQARFQREGYLGPYTLYDRDEMKRNWKQLRRQLLDRSHAAYPVDHAISHGTNIANYDRHLDVDFLTQHITRPEIAHRVQGVLGPDVLCWRTEFFPKYKGDEGTDWHQADTFANASGSPQIVWPEDEDFGGTITVWTAFTDATEKTACLRFIPGTHKTMFYDESKGMKYDPGTTNAVEKEGVLRGFFGYDYRQLQIDPDWKPDESKARSIEMHAGQFILFWSTLMHASCPHAGETEDMRMGFASRYVPTRVRIYPDTEWVHEYGGSIPLDNYGAVLVGGTDRYGYNKVRSTNMRGVPFPKY